jgi:hypothetical protein
MTLYNPLAFRLSRISFVLVGFLTGCGYYLLEFMPCRKAQLHKYLRSGNSLIAITVWLVLVAFGQQPHVRRIPQALYRMPPFPQEVLLNESHSAEGIGARDG